MKNILLFVLCLFPALAFAGMDESIAKINEVMGSMEAASGALALVLEFVLRLIPSEKPLSFAHLGVKFLRGVCLVSERIANFLDKILPQNTKDPE